MNTYIHTSYNIYVYIYIYISKYINHYTRYTHYTDHAAVTKPRGLASTGRCAPKDMTCEWSAVTMTSVSLSSVMRMAVFTASSSSRVSSNASLALLEWCP